MKSLALIIPSLILLLRHSLVVSIILFGLLGCDAGDSSDEGTLTGSEFKIIESSEGCNFNAKSVDRNTADDGFETCLKWNISESGETLNLTYTAIYLDCGSPWIAEIESQGNNLILTVLEDEEECTDTCSCEYTLDFTIPAAEFENENLSISFNAINSCETTIREYKHTIDLSSPEENNVICEYIR